MSLWDRDWFDITDGADVIENIATVWNKRGFNQLTNDDFVRLEPFVEPFDAIYTSDEISILSRLGQNGVQKEFCRLFKEDDAYVLEWYLKAEDHRRIYLADLALLLFGKPMSHDPAQCILLLTYCISTLRACKIVRHGDTLLAKPDTSLDANDEQNDEGDDLHFQSLEDAEVQDE